MPKWSLSTFVPEDSSSLEPTSPPLVTQLTHHSARISWSLPSSLSVPHSDRPCFQIELQMCSSDASKENPQKTIYQGYALFCNYDELVSSQRYRVRVCYKYKGEVSPWSGASWFDTHPLPSTGKDVHRAINNWNEDQLIELLREDKVSVDIPNDEGLSPLMNSAKKGYTNIAKVLLDYGADTTFTTSSGKTAISMACFHGHVEMVELLISYHAPWDIPVKSGLYPIHSAVSGGNLEVVRFFLDKGVCVDLLEVGTKWTPLMRGVVVGTTLEILELLLEKGASTSVRDDEYKTPLMLAVINGREEIVELLLKFGSDPHLSNKYSKNAVDFARTLSADGIAHSVQRHVRILKMLEEYKS
ncbi:Fibronectin type 3 and ankyrin repeat domains protein 1-like [Oopsacas minuta]|uniref:Fibronectin type 3 and ankyrin repeat domains protein 1-like n=1 Tax=Oopsacas minuta TaxID=111878 RepID=A0AAV7KID2_9METZ|nr:Fibronectin type 3 and ankyrin repeat domains protein 1-like [Oopsacas minuta]